MSIEQDSKMLGEMLGENGIANLISSLSSGFGIFDCFENKVKTIYLSGSVKEILGFLNDAPINSSEAGVEYYIHPDDMLVLKKDMERERDIGEISDVDLRLLTRGGGYHWFNFRVVLVKIIDGHEIWNGVCNDIDSRKKNELHLNRIYKTMSETYAIIEYKTETGFQILFTSEDIAKIDPKDNKSLIEQQTRDLFCRIHPDDQQKLREALQRAVESNENVSTIFRIKMANGKYRWVKPNLTVESGTKDSKIIYGTFADIDELVRSNLEIEAERERLRTVIEQANIAVFDWNHINGDIYMSDSFRKYALAGAAEMFIKTNQGDPSIVHPDDLPLLEEFWSKSLKGEPFVSTTIRAKMLDGSYRWTQLSGYFTHDINGNTVRSIGTLVDVDHERSLEHEMQLNLRRLETVIEDTNAQYWEYDIINETADIGEIVRKVYSLPPTMENFPNSLIATGIVPPEYEAEFRKIHIVLKNGALFSELKLPMNSPGGTVRWKHIRYRTIFNSESKPSRAIGTAIDIADQVTAEMKLKQYKKMNKAQQQTY